MKIDHDVEMTGGIRSESLTEIVVNEFTEESAQRFREQVLEFAKRGPMFVIPIYIDSYGGYVDSLAKMIETMEEVPNRFVTICIGKSISCGAILLSHGDMRFCGKYSRVMIHNISSMSWGDVYSMKASSDEGMRLNKVFMGLLAENCGLEYEELQKKIKDSTDSKEIWLDAEDAKELGIIDEIGMPELTPVIQWGCAPYAPKAKIRKEKVHAKPAKKKKTTRKPKK